MSVTREDWRREAWAWLTSLRWWNAVRRAGVAKAKLAARDRQLAYTKELLTEARATLRERDGEIRALHYPGTTPGRRASGAVAPCEACGGAGIVRVDLDTQGMAAEAVVTR